MFKKFSVAAAKIPHLVCCAVVAVHRSPPAAVTAVLRGLSARRAQPLSLFIVNGVPPTSVRAGAKYEYIPSAANADGRTLSFSITNKPDWATFGETKWRALRCPGRERCRHDAGNPDRRLRWHDPGDGRTVSHHGHSSGDITTPDPAPPPAPPTISGTARPPASRPARPTTLPLCDGSQRRKSELFDRQYARVGNFSIPAPERLRELPRRRAQAFFANILISVTGGETDRVPCLPSPFKSSPLPTTRRPSLGTRRRR